MRMRRSPLGLVVLCAALAIPGVARALNKPQNVQATATGPTTARITFEDTNNKEDGYTLERSVSATSGFAQVGSQAAVPGRNSTGTFNDAGLVCGTTYYWRIRAFATNPGPYSLTATARPACAVTTTTTSTTTTSGPVTTTTTIVTTTTTTVTTTTVTTTTTTTAADTTAPSVPGSFGAAQGADCSKINLFWAPSTDTGGSGLKGYNLYRCTAGSCTPTTFIKQFLAPATSGTDTGLTASTTYGYTLKAIDNAGNLSAGATTVYQATAACGGATTTTTATPTTSTTTVVTTTTTTVTTTTQPTVGGDCTTPIVIPAGGGTFTGTTVGAKKLLGGVCGSSFNAPEQVFSWTPSVTGTATIATCGAGTTFDTVLYVQRICGESSSEVACNDDGCGTASSLTVSVTSGTTYYLIVDGFSASQGNFSLKVTPPVATVGFTCPASAPLDTDIVVPVSATVGMHPLGAYGLSVTYDQSVLHVTGIAGATSGFFTGAPVTNSGDWATGTSKFSAYQTSSLTDPTGTVPIARITFHVVGGGGGAPTLGLTVRSMADTSTATIPGITGGGCP